MNAAETSLSGTVYIPDTSALIENPDALDRLLSDGNVVVLLHRVIEELGRLQASRSKPEGIRHAARHVSRKILEYRRSRLIHHHVEALLQHEATPAEYPPTPAGGVLAWEPDGQTGEPYTSDSGDNLIIAGARRITEVAKDNGHSGFTWWSSQRTRTCSSSATPSASPPRTSATERCSWRGSIRSIAA